MNNTAIIAMVFVISISFIIGMLASQSTGLVSQSSYHVSVGMPESQMNWGRGWDSAEKTSARAITVCTPGEKKCLTEEGFAICQSTGTSWSYLTPCPELHYCNLDVNQCVPRDCVHGTTYCRDESNYLKCVNGRIDSDNVYRCELGCDPVTNKCVEPPKEVLKAVPFHLIDAFD
jgi:hypothetical protein